MAEPKSRQGVVSRSDAGSSPVPSALRAVLASGREWTDAAGTGYFNRFVYRAFGEIVSEASLSVPVNWRWVARLGYFYDPLTPALPLGATLPLLASSWSKFRESALS